MIIKRTLFVLLFIAFSTIGYAQEKFGNTWNLGVGVGGYAGYYKYAGRSLPVFQVNYEFTVAKNFTLAPFISVYRFTDEYYWGNNNNPDRFYTYRETVIPVGVKGMYYFDDVLNATSKWDFYLGASLGFAIVNGHWDAGYGGDKNYYHGDRSVFMDLHIGTEYHFNSRVGAFLDLSSGISTIGIAIH